jgi:hypothetical protein
MGADTSATNDERELAVLSEAVANMLHAIGNIYHCLAYKIDPDSNPNTPLKHVFENVGMHVELKQLNHKDGSQHDVMVLSNGDNKKKR